MIAEVVVDVLNSNVDRIYDYRVLDEEKTLLGSRVLVNFAGRNVSGIVVAVKTQSELNCEKLKPILSVLDSAAVGGEMLALMRHMAECNHMLLADILRLFMPGEMRSGKVREKNVQFIALAENADFGLVRESSKKQWEAIEFMREQKCIKRSELAKYCSESAVSTLVEKGVFLQYAARDTRVPYKSIISTNREVALTDAQQSVIRDIIEGESKRFLLFGVTGSGKTEVYMQVISECVRRGKTAIMLVPEIALTPQMLHVFRGRFGEDVALLHSGLSAGERYDEWWRLKTGEAKIAVGARSAIFAPLENVGVIIIDEEHEQSYVPDSGKFTTQDVAEFRRAYNAAKLILGSATPSISTYYDSQCGLLKLLSLPDRVNNKPMPKFTIVDMKKEVRGGNSTMFSSELCSQLENCLKNRKQAMLFINRRGFSSVVMCPECGYVAKCDDCDVSLTYHRDEDVLKCHYCDKRYKMLDICPQCKGERIRQKGLGTERVVSELEKMYPNVRVLRMDNDTTSTKEGHSKIVRAFSDGQADILVGTQMITKGHDFKDVSLVGILDADQSLYFSDYRSVERTFQLITQVAGRAGRADTEGTVVLQTHSPNHYIFALAAGNNYVGFYEREIALRQATNYPPFAHLIRIMFSSADETAAIDNLKNVYDRVCMLREHYSESFIYMNKMKSPVKRISGKFRYQILMRIKTETSAELVSALYDILGRQTRKDVTSYIEIDPNNMS